MRSRLFGETLQEILGFPGEKDVASALEALGDR